MSSLEFHVYSNVDWDGDPNDLKSTIRFCIFLGDSLYEKKNKKWDVVSQSSIEVGFRSTVLTLVAMDSCWYIW